MSFKKLPITVLIPTLNAAGHLEELFASIEPYVEDIYVVDSLSVDKTVDICLAHNVKVVQRHYVTSSDQFGWMLNALPVTTPWIFFMAQDERFSKSLVDSLEQIFSEGIPDSVDGYMIKWRLWFMGQPLHAVVPNLRLLRTGKCYVTNVACNEHFVVKGGVKTIAGILEHKDTLNLHEWYEKQNMWTTREAIQRVKPPSEDEYPRLLGGTRIQRKAYFKIVLGRIPGGETVRFLYYYLWFGAWKDGFAGWSWARLRVWVEHVIQLKAREMRRNGIPTVVPTGRHGDFDARVVNSDLQKRLLPKIVEEWEVKHR